MKILFLTNNPKVSDVLYTWLTDSGEDVLYETKPVNDEYIINNAIEFIISYNYLHIIRQEVIDLLPHRIINLHISFLPYNRGASPNIWSFINCTPCGVTIHEVDAGVDTGDILLQQQITFDIYNETLSSTYEKLHNTIQNLFYDNWDMIKRQRIIPYKQPDGGTVHKRVELQRYEQILRYDEIIAEFLNKVKGQ